MDSFASTSIGPKILASIFTVSYLLQFVAPAITTNLGLVPGKTILQPWNIVTSGLVQDNLVILSISVPAVLFLSRSIEAVHGQSGFLKLIGIALLGAGIATFFLVTTIYFIIVVGGGAGVDSAGDILYNPICGFQGGLGALLVGVKQAIPDHEITVFSAIHFKAKHLPGLYLIITLVLGIATGSTLKLLPFAFYGTYIAWFYLRYFAYRTDSFMRGDPVDDFRFATFFPTAVQPLADNIAKVAAAVTRLNSLVEAHAQQAQKDSAALLGQASPSKDTFEVTRRRERGARALEERLGLTSAAGLPPLAVSTSAVALQAAEAGAAS